jgi:hypothetical protein
MQPRLRRAGGGGGGGFSAPDARSALSIDRGSKMRQGSGMYLLTMTGAGACGGGSTPGGCCRMHSARKRSDAPQPPSTPPP